MFPGSGFGVAVTVAELHPSPVPLPVRRGVTETPMRLHEMLPADGLTDAELAREIQAATRAESLVAAYRAERVAQLAARRPAAADRQRSDPGSAREADPMHDVGVSEFFPDELAQIMNCSRSAATRLTETALTLLTRLPRTWEAVSSGELDWPRARGLADELSWPARDTDPALVAEVEAAVLPSALDMSIPTLRAAARRELLARDAASADRRARQAERSADVVARPAPDGMAELSVVAPQPIVAALRATIDSYARLARATGDPRPLGQLRVGVLTDLVLRPWDRTRPPVTALLTVHAPLPAVPGPDPGSVVLGGAQPTAEVDGQPITATALRSLLEQLDAACPGGLQPPAGGTLTIAITDPASGALRAAVTRPELERLAARGCPAHPEGFCDCPILDRPPPVDRYRSTPGQRRFVSTRDRTCRHPGCRNRAAWADLDHVLAHAAGGETDCGNLCCLCRRHHRLKTHAEGWSFVMDDDGVLTVTTPSGVTRVTRPPGLQPPDPPDEPASDPPPF